MREIKFRAWDIETKEMSYDFLSRNWLMVCIQSPYVELMQYTGLKDKHGVEIYEGDILRTPAKDMWERKNYIGYEVFYHDNDSANNHVGFQMNRLHFHGSLGGGGMLQPTFLPKYTSQMEIIGNVWEHPHLLEGRDEA